MMRILVYFGLSIAIGLWQNAAANPLLNAHPFHCPFPNEINLVSIKPDMSDLKAANTIDGYTVHWTGWVRSQQVPTYFKYALIDILPISDPPKLVVACAYTDAEGHYAKLTPDLPYHCSGVISGEWQEGMNLWQCDNNSPETCVFGIEQS